MTQNYIVFTENTALYLGTYEQWQGESLEIKPEDDAKEMMKKANSFSGSAVLLPWSFEQLCAKCLLVTAAGGIVEHDAKALFIKKNGTWDFPKGWIDEGEYPMQTALREVREECGKLDLTILSPKPIITYHVYQHKKKVILKKTFWYTMGCNEGYRLKPQKKEGITETTFIPLEKIDAVIEESYPMIRYLWKTFKSLE